MKTPVYNQEGAEIETMELPEKMFGLEWNGDLVHQVAVSQMANRRKAIAHTKHRGEVSGGGKKPWAQKGTGRSRQGSTRSPLWRHGGVVFGPRSDRAFSQKINDKMRRKALCMVFSEKARKNFLVVVDAIALQEPKTKLLKNILQKLPSKSESSMLILSLKDESLQRAGRNLPLLSVVQARNVNVLDLLSAKFLVITKEGIQALQNTFVK
ncbi:MAG: 50S ribosomal protein L4 [Candidatus Wildermuthbacteria bacterium]|nr:50S ribosomal protein L4 [Candidatus Wildermuthbacteria bacterium]